MDRPARFRYPLLLVFAGLLAPALLRAGQNPAPAPAPVLPANAQTPAPAGKANTTLKKPQPTPTPEELGDSLEARQRYQAAIAAYAQDPKPNAAIWNKMGIAYQMMFNLRNAEHCYKESLKLDPKNPMVLNNLGTIYDSLKDYPAAQKMYRKALKINPKSPLILKNLGTNLLEQRKYSRGWAAYEKAMAMDPGIFEDHSSPTVSNPTALRERGAMNYYMARGCVRMGQTECALEYLRRALDEGFTTVKKVSEDADFASLRENPAFKQLLAEQKQQPQQHP